MPSCKQLEVKTNLTLFLCEIITDITTRNSERKDTIEQHKKLKIVDHHCLNFISIRGLCGGQALSSKKRLFCKLIG